MRRHCIVPMGRILVVLVIERKNDGTCAYLEIFFHCNNVRTVVGGKNLPCQVDGRGVMVAAYRLKLLRLFCA